MSQVQWILSSKFTLATVNIADGEAISSTYIDWVSLFFNLLVIFLT